MTDSANSVSRIVEIRTPGAIIFGVGCREQLTERARQLCEGTVLLVTDQGLVKAGIAEKIKALIGSAGVAVEVFDAVDPDPDRQTVGKCLELAKSANVTAVVGLGGGSSLDVAKMVAALCVNKGTLEEYTGIEKLPKKGLPTVLLPTTAGTGSEASPIAVISDKKQHLKLGVVSRHLYCDVAIVDPELTVSCPAKVTASAGIDTLTHAIEIYTNKHAVPIVDTLVLEAIRLVGLSLRKCVEYGSDLKAREQMSLAALYGGMGLGPVNTAAVHALAYPLGGTYDIAHGLANSILLPYVMEFNRPACEEKFARIGEVLGVTEGSTSKKAAAAVEAVAKLSADVGIPKRLREVGIPADAIDGMAVGAMKVTRLLNNNPRELTEADARDIYQRAY